MKVEIYPIYLDAFIARRLVNEHAQKELKENTRHHFRGYTYEYWGYLLETGEVSLNVRYSFDDGFAMGAGPCLDVKIRPFTAEQIASYEDQKFMLLAAEELERQEEEKRNKQLEKIANQLRAAYKK